MKKLILVLVLFITIPVFADEKPTFFGSETQCVAALMSGEYTTYFVRAQWRGKKIEGVVKPLEAVACLEGEVVGGRNWVVVPAGFNLRWQDNKPVAMEDCGGNPVYAIAFLPAPSAPTVAPASTTCCPSVTKEDILEAARVIAAAQGRYSQPPTLDRPRRGWCGIFATDRGCNIAGGLLLIGLGASQLDGGNSSRGKGGTL